MARLNFGAGVEGWICIVVLKQQAYMNELVDIDGSNVLCCKLGYWYSPDTDALKPWPAYVSILFVYGPKITDRVSS